MAVELGKTSIGTLFRQKREEKGVSLKEVENIISIRAAHLEALEEDRLHDQLSTVYVQGFTRQYGQYLGLDLQELYKYYPHLFQEADQHYEFSYGIGTLESRGNTPKRLTRKELAIWVCAFLSLALLGWFVAKWFSLF